MIMKKRTYTWVMALMTAIPTWAMQELAEERSEALGVSTFPKQFRAPA